VAVPPGATEGETGVTVSVKSGAVTFSVTVAECVSEPLVPVIISGELLAELPGAVITVSVELPGALIEGQE